MNIKSIKYKIPAFFTIYLLIMILLSATLIINMMIKNALDEKLTQNAVIAELVGTKINLYLTDAMTDIITSAKYISENEKTEENMYYEINRIYNNYSNFDLVFFTNTEGKMVFANPYNPVAIDDRNYTDRDYYNHIMAYEEPFISSLYVSRVLDKPHFVLAAPVFHEGRIYGLMAGGIPLKEVKNIILSMDITFNGGIWVTDSRGSLIVNPYEDLSDDHMSVFENYSVKMNDEETDIYSVISKGTKGSLIMERENGIFYVAIKDVKGGNLSVMVEQEANVLFNEAYQIIDGMKYIVLIIIAVGVALGFVISLGITKPLQKLVHLVRIWGVGGEDKFSEVSMNRQDEIGELANTFKDMTYKLDLKVIELKKSIERENEIQQYLNNILMSVGSGIIVIGTQGRIVIFNKAAETICGFDSKEMIGKEYTFLSKNIHFNLGKVLLELKRENQDIIEKEGLILNKDKRNIPCRILCSKVKNNQDLDVGYVFLLINLEVFKKMEEELKREDRLSIAGEFSSSIIHDIGNPLAGLSNLLELFNSNMSTQEEKNEIILLLEAEINELNNIVLEFLNFTKSREKENDEMKVDICQILLEAVNILRAEMINRDIKIHTTYESEIIYANIDRRNFKQAMINIIKNSIQAIVGNGHIYLDIKEKDDIIRIVVKDTGIGIKEYELENIFKPFYTTKKDGTGLGLSTAYNTIRENDGKLEVTSRYKEGTEFIITIPNRRNL